MKSESVIVKPMEETMHSVGWERFKRLALGKYELLTHIVILAVVGLYLFFLGNGNIAITDPVESNYALTAKEMVNAHNYMSPQIYGNYWYDKPIFFYWELIAAFKMFGISEWAARFFPAVFGMVGLYMTYWFAQYLYNRKTALVASLVLATSFEYWLISKTVITDMTLFVFFNAALIFFYLGYKENSKYYWGAWGFSALAVLTKGPIGLLLPGLIAVLFMGFKRNWKAMLSMKWISGFILFALIGAPWYVYMYDMHGMDFIMTFLGVHNILRATVSEHPNADVWYYYMGIFIIGFFPWVFTVPMALKKYWREKRWPQLDDATLFMLVWVVTVAVFFQLMATKYTTYTFPYLLPIAILAAKYLVDHRKLVTGMVLANIALYTVLTFWVAMPYTNLYSGRSISAAVVAVTKPGDTVVSYGDYRTSAVFYSGHMMSRVAKAEDIPKLKPSAMSWNNKNVMPFISEDDVNKDAHVIALVSNKKEKEFLKTMQGKWEVVERFGQDTLYRKVSL